VVLSLGFDIVCSSNLAVSLLLVQSIAKRRTGVSEQYGRISEKWQTLPFFMLSGEIESFILLTTLRCYDLCSADVRRRISRNLDDEELKLPFAHAIRSHWGIENSLHWVNARGFSGR